MNIKQLFGSECKFVAGATNLRQIPVSNLLEVAFVGRSNVGKSSLINALTGKNCARVSKTPGRTQQINFFNLGNKLSLVDLPGYGYASVSKKTRAEWDSLIIDYLQYRVNLKRIFLLIDSKVGIKKNDEEVMQIFDTFGLVYQLILTKADKKSKEVEENIKQLIEQHSAAYPEYILTSSKGNIGIRELQGAIVQMF